MAITITLADGRTLLGAILSEFKEDYNAQARILRVLKSQCPAVDWATEIRTQAQAGAMGSSGLSITWWANEVNRLSG